MGNILDTLITDRVPEDARRLRAMDKKGWAKMSEKERTEYRSGPKGGYCHIDMNRVTAAMEYLDGIMRAAGKESGYTPLEIPHTGSGGKTWTDTVWIDYDKPSPSQWAAYLGSVERFWSCLPALKMEVLPVYDPDMRHHIELRETFTAGDICSVAESSRLLRLFVAIQCDPDAVAADGLGWDVKRTASGLSASYYYPGWMFADIADALKALRFRCIQEDGVFDAVLTFTAELRPGDVFVTPNPCMVRWSSYITWGDAHDLYETWADTKCLDWWLFEHGYDQRYPFILADGPELTTADGEQFYCLRC